MPAHINYETTPIIFYKFVCETPEIKSCYVGHTTNFMNRQRQHKYCYSTEKCSAYNLKIYQIIRENFGWDKWKMVEIDRQICLDRSHACKIEQKYIEELQANMNSNFANRSKQQYDIDNKEHNYQLTKKWYLKNKEKLTNKITCMCGRQIRFSYYKEHLKTKIHTDYLATINNIVNIQNEFSNSEEQST